MFINSLQEDTVTYTSGHCESKWPCWWWLWHCYWGAPEPDVGVKSDGNEELH